jgi:hypothetical protein
MYIEYHFHVLSMPARRLCAAINFKEVVVPKGNSHCKTAFFCCWLRGDVRVVGTIQREAQPERSRRTLVTKVHMQEGKTTHR